ncbi:MAG: ABC transporter permease [Firmicutes bacterium]|nr:ABC transporter permease [Bacillota bacterium]
MLCVLAVLSLVIFFIIQLPPGDYLTSYVMQLRLSGQEVSDAELAALERQYGLDRPFMSQYFKWITNWLRGDLGRSFQWNRPVRDLLAERLPITILISLSTLVFTYAVAIPIGIYSATHQYSFFDYAVTILGFIGVSVPGFLLAMLVMFFFHRVFGVSVGGLFSPELVDAPWSFAKAIDLINHLWIPIIVIGLSGTAGVIRVMRGCLLDELNKPYVDTARSKGLTENVLLFKYPVRIALNPIISTIGWILPGIFSGQTIVAVVLNLPTVGPLLLNSLMFQDMYLAGSIVMILSTLTVLGTFISDLLLAYADPRIRYD